MSGKLYSEEFKQGAGKLTSSLVAGKDVKVEVYDTDRYGRTVGFFLPIEST
ncbi:thermonuclease family protein [Thermodesulfobacteriota bacterium]